MAKTEPTENGRKSFLHGTHRTISPAETIVRIQPLLNHMGITRTANVTGLDRIGIPVVTVMRPNSRSLSVSQGKGVDLEAAKASGIMEAVESFHAERIDQPLKLGSYNDLAARHRLADVDRLARLRESRFHRDLPIMWIEGHDLIGNTTVWLPYEIVHANYTLPAPTGSGCFVASTNGLASGNHILEAIAHGIAEVVERDANSMWNHLSDEVRRQTRVDLETVDDELCQSVLDKLRLADMSVGVWEITTDIGIPSFYCLITDNRLEMAHSGAGAGSHPAREIALLRALTEAVQVRTNYMTGARDDLGWDEYETAGIAAKLRRARNLMRDRADRAINYRKIPTRGFATQREDVDWMLQQLKAVGIEQVLSVDLTRPEFGLPVARIVIPGLEGPDDHDDYLPGTRARAIARARP